MNVPKYYTWCPSTKKYSRRAQGTPVEGFPGIKAIDALGRVYTVHPNNFECFCLRLLLHHVDGPTSFQDLRTVNGHICETFREACNKRDLLEDDNHWNATLTEAAATDSPNKLRYLFAIMMCSCGLSNPKHLWETHKDSLSEDILHHIQQDNPTVEVIYTSTIYNRTLLLLEELVISISNKALKDFGMPSPVFVSNSTNRELLRETNYCVDTLNTYIADNEPLLIPDQKHAYDTILHRIVSRSGGFLFLDAPGGTGKTFLINLLLAKVRSQRKIALAVAYSGIAATLLNGGRTAHSTFKLPLNLSHDDTPVCNIKKGSGIATVLERCHLIVWDECTMSHKRAFEALDRTLQDIRGNNTIFGGVTLVIAGDFRQTLPVIPRSTPADELNACLKASYLWQHVEKLTLSTNMRVHLHNDSGAGRFADLLLEVGNGALTSESDDGEVRLPVGFGNLVTTGEELMNKVYPNLSHHYKDTKWLCKRAILAPKNDIVEAINNSLLNKLAGKETIFKSVYSVVDPNSAVQYPTEFLNSLQPPGLPPHNLILKVGAPIMLLRNLDPPRLCNGTRLTVKYILPHVLEATILTGPGTNEDIFIPRIPLMPVDIPFEFKRLQFPVRLSFAITINKSQGQSLGVVGLYLESPCFSHGQLYVGSSRVSSAQNLYIFVNNGKTRNIVYPLALH